MSIKSLTLITTYDPTFLKIVEYLVTEDIKKGLKPSVLDITKTSTIPVDTYNRSFLKLFNIDFPGSNSRERFESLGVEFIDISLLADTNKNKLDKEAEEALTISIQSALITFTREEKPDRKKRKIRKLALELEREARIVFDATQTVLSRETFELIRVPNGRFPNQNMAVQAARMQNVKCYHYEKGEGPGSIYYWPYPPQDRINSQLNVSKFCEQYSDSQVTSFAYKWLQRRTPSESSINEFSENWTDVLPHEISNAVKSRQKIVGFFTSSQDEFQFLGPEWQIHEWESQEDAFAKLISEFTKSGYLCFLRVHPNLATKAPATFNKEQRAISELQLRFPELIVIRHDETYDSYKLMDCSDFVVVWDSTVGVEANAKGKPVIVCAATKYSLVADVKEIYGPSYISKELTVPWNVNVLGAHKYITYFTEGNLHLPAETYSWIPWNESIPPWQVKFAALLNAGGSPTPFSAIKMSLEVWKNRSLRFNLKIIKSRISKNR